MTHKEIQADLSRQGIDTGTELPEEYASGKPGLQPRSGRPG